MYKFSFLIVVFIAAASYGQNANKSPVKEKLAISRGIAGSDLLRAEDLKVAQFLKENPDYFTQIKLMKSAAWGFSVGSTKTWKAHNFETNSEYSVASTCRAVGTHCYIFVADDVWGTRVDSAAVSSVVDDFDNHTPADPGKGIYQMDVETFGDPPDVDSDPKIIILILDIQDGFSNSGNYIAGYFSSGNEVRSDGLAAEIYFMDANPVDLKTSSGLNFASGTAAHEFQHMINWNYHKTNPELTFINEGLSMVAEIVCGYGASMQSLYSSEPNHYLFDWRSNDDPLVLNDYARAQRFFLYFKEQLGIGSLKSFVQSYTNYGLVGISGLKKILENYSTSLGKVFLNFSIANGLNDLTVQSEYGYSYQSIPVTIGSIYHNPNINSTSGTLQNLGANYFTFSASSDLSVTFTSSGSNIMVKALEIGTPSRVVDVPLNTAFTESGFPSMYNTIRFATIDTNQSSAQDYQYQASGSISGELKWDETEPTGYFILTTNDTVCVTFDAFPGGKLDSIKVALRRAGSITGGIWESTGVVRPTPLGKKLAGPITASISTDAQLVNPNSKYPYNIPYTNWSTVDLRSYSISTNQPFAVGFVIGSDPATPGIMATEFASSVAYHSYTYLQTSDQVSSPDWYFLSTNSDTVSIYLIRAYVSLTTGIKEEIELTPGNYSLSQNYPNPFNPSTTIKFGYGKNTEAQLKVYDVLGNEVANLFDGNAEAGRIYQINFDGSKLSSGVYYYRLTGDNKTEVKKMVLLK